MDFPISFYHSSNKNRHKNYLPSSCLQMEVCTHPRATAILEIDLGNQTGRNTIHTHSYCSFDIGQVEVYAWYVFGQLSRIYTCTPPPLPIDLSSLTTLNFGTFTTSSGTLSDNHVSVIRTTSGLS